MLVNNSWSGSRVTKLPGKDSLFPAGCSDERTGGLHIGTVLPDVIIVYIGTNDWFYGVQAEEKRKGYCDGVVNASSEGHMQGDEAVFSVAYTRMLDRIKSNYPAAEIFCCTLNEAYVAIESPFVFQHVNKDLHIDCYNDIIRHIAALKCCTLIDLGGARLPYNTFDGVHPAEAGMDTLACLVLHGMCNQEGLRFMECEFSQHEFVTALEYTGGTQYVCRKCGRVDHYNMLNPAEFKNLYAGSTIDGEIIQRTEPNTANRKNGYLYDAGKSDNCPNRHAEKRDSEDEAICQDRSPDPDIIDLNPDCTTMLYSPEMGIRLFSVSREEEFTIYKTAFNAGRGQDCDLRLTNNYVARLQATFMLDEKSWLLRDNFSANGTWLNGTKLVPGKKYVLHPDDVIDFAHSEKFVFYKTQQRHNQENEGEKALAYLEAGIKTFHDSDHKDEMAFKLIVAALIDAPLYLPVEIDAEAMLGGADPTKLKPGDVLQPQKRVRMKVKTLTVDNIEFVPMFTTPEEVDKGPSVSTIRMYPQDYLPQMMQMGKDVAINPFSGKAFIFNQKMMQELVWPIVQQKLQKGNGVQVNSREDELLGQTVAGKYHLISLLGRSGYFCVFLAIGNDNRNYTVKVWDKSRPGMEDSLRSQLLQEPYLMMKFHHSAIPKVIDIIEDEKHLFVVREYVEGETLADLITKHGPLSAEKAVAIGIELAGVLQYLHTFTPAYIYRDMKPANVIVTPSGSVKLIDFGIAMQYNPNETEDINCYGTRGYAAPEQFISKGRIDPRTDIYGLGITLHQCVTGIQPNIPPYETPPIRKVRPELPKGLEYIIGKCIEMDPNNRYQTCQELMSDLKNYQKLPPKKSLLSSLFQHNTSYTRKQ